jgi:hypothetical protein
MATTRLSRTPSSTGNRKTWTFSAWIKRTGKISGTNTQNILHAGSYSIIRFENENLEYLDYDGSSTTLKNTSAKLRDINGWYHIVVAADFTQASADNRVKFYINGEQVTSFGTNNVKGQNYDTQFNLSGTSMNIGADSSNGSPFDGLMSHIHFTDGTAYDASAFGETDSTTGIWTIKTSPSVTYGTNGFFILKNGNSVTDQSGQSNNFTVANGTLTSLKDCPDNVFATWSPLHSTTQSISNVVFKNNNTTFDNNETTNAVYPQVYSTLAASSGKYYLESKLIASNGNTASYIGISGAVTTEAYIAENAYTYAYRENGTVRNNDVNGNTYTSYGVNDIIQIAVDLDNNKLYFGINGTWVNSGDPTSGATGTGAVFTITAPSSTPHGVYHFTIGDTSSPGTFEHATNFGNGYFGTTAVTSAQNPDDGNGIFEYDVPAGYRALCTKSLNAEEYS